MELEALVKLEERVKTLVNTQKQLREENARLNAELEKFHRQSNVENQERMEIKSKVENLIRLIDSIESAEPAPKEPTATEK